MLPQIPTAMMKTNNSMMSHKKLQEPMVMMREATQKSGHALPPPHLTIQLMSSNESAVSVFEMPCLSTSLSHWSYYLVYVNSRPIGFVGSVRAFYPRKSVDGIKLSILPFAIKAA